MISVCSRREARKLLVQSRCRRVLASTSTSTSTSPSCSVWIMRHSHSAITVKDAESRDTSIGNKTVTITTMPHLPDCSQPLGSPMPVDEHACSVSLPTWSSVVGYEEGNPAVTQAMQCGYPRFVYHPYVLQLMKYILAHHANEREDCLLLPSIYAARRCQIFLFRALLGDDAPADLPDPAWVGHQTPEVVQAQAKATSLSDSKIRIVSVNVRNRADVHAVIFPATTAAGTQAKAYWQHTGEVVSSRRAQACLQDLGVGLQKTVTQEQFSYHEHNTFTDTASEDDAWTQLRQSLSTWARTSPHDVILTPSGMSAVYVALQSARRRHMELHPEGKGGISIVYGFPYLDTLKLCSRSEFFPDGVEFFGRADARDLIALEAYLEANPNSVSVVMTEVPSNPLLHCPNVVRLRELASRHNFLLVVDDTIANHLNVNLLESGLADATVSSLTKLVSGRGDAMAGSVVCNPHTQGGRWMQKDLSSAPEGVHSGLYCPDAMAIHRNAQDFVERNGRINQTTEKLAEWLSEQGAVERVYYPKLSHSAHLYHQVQCGGYGGLLSMVLAPHMCERTFYDALDVAKGPSLGTNFTLVCPYTLLAHYHELDFAMSYDVPPNLIRIAVGLEPFDVLKEKFDKALNASRLYPKVCMDSVEKRKQRQPAKRNFSTTSANWYADRKQLWPSGRRTFSSIVSSYNPNTEEQTLGRASALLSGAKRQRVLTQIMFVALFLTNICLSKATEIRSEMYPAYEDYDPLVLDPFHAYGSPYGGFSRATRRKLFILPLQLPELTAEDDTEKEEERDPLYTTIRDGTTGQLYACRVYHEDELDARSLTDSMFDPPILRFASSENFSDDDADRGFNEKGDQSGEIDRENGVEQVAAKSAGETSIQKDDSTAWTKLVERLDALEEVCGQIHKGWWSYEWCNEGTLAQFHVAVNPDASGIEVHDITNLGDFKSRKIDFELEEKEENPLAGDQKEVARVYDYHEEGTVCPDTGKPRRSTVTLLCCTEEVMSKKRALLRRGEEAIVSKDVAVYDIVEDPKKVCNYNVTVCTPLLCSDSRQAFELDSTNEADTHDKVESRQALHRENESVMQILERNMGGKTPFCLQSITGGWWTYEYCHGKNIRQYHEVIGTKRDKNGASQTTRVVETDHNLGSSQTKPGQIRPEEEWKYMVNATDKSGAKKPYFELEYSNGDVCDDHDVRDAAIVAGSTGVKGVARASSVRYVCGERFDISVSEDSTCHYVVNIAVPDLCKHPLFKTPVSKQQIFKCLPIDEPEVDAGSMFD